MGRRPKVFLGGTSASSWRELLIPRLTINYFNPVVEDWTPECMAEERRQRKLCDFCLYVITPKMTGVYSIAEAVDDSNNCPTKTVFSVMKRDGEDEFTQDQLISLEQVMNMIADNGGATFYGLAGLPAFFAQSILLY